MSITKTEPMSEETYGSSRSVILRVSGSCTMGSYGKSRA